MKKKIFLLAFCCIGMSAFAQWNYDNQNMLYSSSKAVTVGNATMLGQYTGVDDKALEVYSPTFTTLLLQTGTNKLWLINSQYGNYLSLPNNKPFDMTMSGVSAPALRVQTNGSVAIGTSVSPTDYKLAVGGKIIAEELKVQLQASWPDYVFSDNYRLPTLDQVEKQIKEKKHLANMPSAEQVDQEGFNVGELTRLQQEKIEELTLYIIELNKKLKEQDERMMLLESKIKN